MRVAATGEYLAEKTTMIQSRFARRTLVIAAHLALWILSLGGALYLRFDGSVPRDYFLLAGRVLPLLVLVRVATFWQAGLFHGILRYAGMAELKSIVRATTLGSVGVVVVGLFVHRLALPRSIYILEWLLCLASTGGLRLIVRLLLEGRAAFRTSAKGGTPVILLGAGDAGELLLRDLHRSGALSVACVLDDDLHKRGALLHGVRIAGGIDRSTLERVMSDSGATRAILAMPTAPGPRTREILEICRDLGLTLQTIPSLQQLADGSVRISKLRDIAIEDLLRRDSVSLDTTSISGFLAGRRVLVTGGAGSIGSELIRQIARFKPATITVFDHNENGLFFLERELRRDFPQVGLRFAVGSIRDSQRLEQVFEDARPDVVYHAAAHKHVPLMEANPGEAVRNNVLGTKMVADAADRFGTEAFVMISTDKAVRPTSVMGTTKRVAEMYVQSLSGRSKTRFVAVRFGNVLGSNGSVVPLFREQIEAGGPVLVTHPDMTRYFMTIPEASQLVLQASALGKGGEIFILDMGQPVKIADLARDMIQLSGLEPDVDIAIEYTGTRPGEKLYEELVLDDESAAETAHPKIKVARIAPQDATEMQESVARLERLVMQTAAVETIRAELSVLVPEAKLGQKAIAAGPDRQVRISGVPVVAR